MNTMTVDIDPTDSFKGIKPKKLLEATGLLSHFALDVAYSTPESVQEAFSMLMDCYGYGMGQDGVTDATVSPEGVYSYPEDPDLYPLVAFGLTEDIIFYVYQYAICAVTDGTDTLMMRMD
jgi:hypothetical protein